MLAATADHAEPAPEYKACGYPARLMHRHALHLAWQAAPHMHTAPCAHPAHTHTRPVTFLSFSWCVHAQELRTVFMINCGGTEDVRASCNIDDTVRVIVMDSHRPIWHGYNDATDQNSVVVVDEDDPVPPEDVPTWNETFEAAQQQGERIKSSGPCACMRACA